MAKLATDMTRSGRLHLIASFAIYHRMHNRRMINIGTHSWKLSPNDCNIYV